MFDDGTDLLEPTMSVEEAFEIMIPDGVMECIKTAGDLADYVARRVGAANRLRAGEACASATAFYRVRRVLVELSGVEKRLVRPGASMDMFLSMNSRRDDWRRIMELLGVAHRPLMLAGRWAALPAGSLVGGVVCALVSGLAWAFGAGMAGAVVSVAC